MNMAGIILASLALAGCANPKLTERQRDEVSDIASDAVDAAVAESDKISALEARIDELETKAEELESKADDLEARVDEVTD